LDGNEAALAPPSAIIITAKTNETIELAAPNGNLNNYQHGLILYHGDLNPEFPFDEDAKLIIEDHPISEFDVRSTEYTVNWQNFKCKQHKTKQVGRTVFRKVIPNCKKEVIDRSIRASLRQLDHILDLEILQLSFSDESEGINVVITSTVSGLTEMQRSEIEDAISIGRILVQCLSENESVDEII